MRILIITGGTIGKRLEAWLSGETFDVTIAVDGGLEAADQFGRRPQYIVGDFDTVSGEILEKYQSDPKIEIRRFCPEKDATDTQIAYDLAIELFEKNGVGEKELVVAGGIGTRFDHSLANIFLLEKLNESGIRACCMDDNNRVSVHTEPFEVLKEKCIGEYISFHALSDSVLGLTLSGFKYELNGYNLTRADSLCVSNEIVCDVAKVSFTTGKLLMVQATE